MDFRRCVLVLSMMFVGLNEANAQPIQTDLMFRGLETIVVGDGLRIGDQWGTLTARSIYGEDAGFITHSFSGPNGVSVLSRSPAADPDLVLPGIGSIPISIFSTNAGVASGANSIDEILDSLQGVWEFGVQPNGQPIQSARYEFQPPAAWGYAGMPQDFDINFQIQRLASSYQNPEELLFSYEFNPTAASHFDSIDPNRKQLALRVSGIAEDGQAVSASVPIAYPTNEPLGFIAPFLTDDSEAITQLGQLDLSQPLQFALAATFTSDPFSSTPPDAPLDQVVTTLIAPSNINFKSASILSSYQNFIEDTLIPEPSSAFVLLGMVIGHRRLRLFLR